jgi:hypothetical protein
MSYDSDEPTDTAALTRNLVMLGLVLAAVAGYTIWRQFMPSAVAEHSSGASRDHGAMPVSTPRSTAKAGSSQGSFVVGPDAVTADEARQHLKAWADKTYQVDGLTPEPPHLPKDRWKPYAAAFVAHITDGPDKPSAMELHSMARDLAPVAKEHPVSAYTVGVILGGESGSGELLQAAAEALAGQAGSEALAYRAAAVLALSTSGEEGRATAEKRVEAAMKALRRLLDAEQGLSKMHDRVAAHLLMGGSMEAFFEHMHEPVMEEVAKTASAKPWLKKWIEGEHCLKRAWEARGGGYSNTVSRGGFAVFHHESEKARRLFAEAWELKPETPEPAVSMIYASLSMDQGEARAHMRQWFGEVLSLQVDVPKAAEHMLWGLRPRWHGSLEQMRDFGLACAETARHDSSLPWVLLQAHRDFASEWDVPAEYFKELSDRHYNSMAAVFDGAEAEPKRAPWRQVDRTHAAVFAFKCRRYADAAKWLQKLDQKPSLRALDLWGDIDTPLLTGKTAAYAEPALGTLLQQAESAEQAFQAAAAAKHYEEALEEGGDKLQGAGRNYVEHRLAATRIESRARSGEAASLVPENTHFRGWTRQGGGWELDGGAWLHRGREALRSTTCEARIGPHFTLEGEVEVTDPGDATQFWFAYGYPERGDGRWIALRFQYDGKDTRALLSGGLGEALEQPKIDVQSRFSFRLSGMPSAMTLHVNDKVVFQNVPAPPGYVKEQYSQIGIGAYTGSERTRVRIHRLTVKR